jgi:hypothetical protein
MAFEKWPRGAAHTRVTSVMLTPDWMTRLESVHVYVGMPCAYTRNARMTPAQIGPFDKP